ncbi:MAG: 5'/3'-nucleotidase SurE [Bacteroidota bacterium]|nr:5'/3'-nucleotidase SurE [Bacteroidota bacterium]
MNKPLILVTNDDGINAPGIRALIEIVRPFGEVVVVAPDKPQSGMGHAITINNTLRVNHINTEENYQEHSCSGTPVDCVKLAVKKIMHRKPDLLVSGINHGYNSSINVIYSGTMSAAIEGALENIPSIGFSLGNHSIEADFSAAKKYAEIIIETALKSKMPDKICLNVNFPPIEYQEINGIKICRQSDANWDENFDERLDPSGNKYYWLTGVFKNYDKGEDTDLWALTNNFVSIVPVQYDLTAHKAINDIEKWNKGSWIK